MHNSGAVEPAVFDKDPVVELPCHNRSRNIEPRHVCLVRIRIVKGSKRLRMNIDPETSEENRIRMILLRIGDVFLPALTIYTLYVFSGLPSLERIENPQPELATKVYSGSTGFFIKNRSQGVCREGSAFSAIHTILSFCFQWYFSILSLGVFSTPSRE